MISIRDSKLVRPSYGRDSAILTSGPVVRPRSARRTMVRVVCVSTAATLAWGTVAGTASAAPDPLARAPLASSSVTGLREGAQGAEVKSLQQALIEAGVSVPGGADGVFGPATRGAVVAFQQQHGLDASGDVDHSTADALAAATSGGGGSAAGTGSSNGSYVGLQQGAEGAPVKKVQQRLMDLGTYVAGGADGIFGGATTRAVKQFQGWNGLTSTGTVTQATVKRLGLTADSESNSGSATTTASNPYLGLTVGAQGTRVKDVQQALINAGVNILGGADGVFGNATKGGLVQYQRSAGITADGTVNQATVDKLGLGSSTAPAPLANSGSTSAASPSSDGTYVGLTVGSSGSLVRELQIALQNTGLVLRGGADGQFGNATKASLIAYQSVNGMDRTGVVSQRIVDLMGLGSGGVSIPESPNGGSVTLDRFPVQGQCFFGDTWHAARGGGRKHEGVDIIAAEGKLLYAVVDGHISKLYWDYPGAMPGNGLRVAQDNGTYFTYLHMSSFAPGIEEGTKVTAGDVIGFVGNTGSSATAHLHFEIHPGGGAAVNPYPYMKAMNECNNTTPQYQSSFNPG